MKIWIEQALLEHLDSWSKFTLKPIAVESHLFEQFWIVEWRNRPQNRNLHEKLCGTSPPWKFWLLVRICAKVNFLEIGQFAQFPSLEWRNGSQNQNVLKKLSGTGSFWKFWLSVKIYEKVNFLEIGYLCNFRVSHEETDPKIGMYSRNWVGQVRFKNFDFFVKVKCLVKLFFL